MSVALRKRDMSGGRQRYFLDYYYDGQRRQESLKLYIYKRPKNEEEKAHNKEADRQAKSIRSKRELEQNASEHGVTNTFKKSVDFLAYFQYVVDRYTKKNLRGLEATLNHLRDFTGKKTLSTRQLTEQFCIEFRDHLSRKLHGETPYDYFAHFKRVLKRATREGILSRNPALEVTSKRVEGKMKDVLNIEEIQKLASTPCGNEEVKRAFLFACFTGLRTCDLRELKWQDIRGNSLSIVQSKTQKPHTVYLKATAKKLLGKPGKPEQNIFTLPTQNGANSVLKNWAKRAGLHQHVTFHSARASFATNLFLFDTDFFIVSNVMGHANSRHTKRYLKVAEEKKQKGVERLPDINL